MSGWFFLIVGLMKGHVGGGSSSGGFRASGARLSNKPFRVFGFWGSLGFRGWRLMSYYTPCNVQERLLEVWLFGCGISPVSGWLFKNLRV